MVESDAGVARQLGGLCAITLALMAAVLAAAPPARAQGSQGAPSPREGLFRIGPVFLTPSLRVGQVGYDSNVFYTATERTGDFIADGGPGLELVLPLGQAVRLGARGGVNFLYFAQTESQRRTTWNADAFLSFEGSRTRAVATSIYTEGFRRPEFEVDDRVLEVIRRTALQLNRQLGRNELLVGLEARRLDITQDQDFAGTDLRQNLNRTNYKGLLGLHLGITSKTSFVLEADYERDEFEFTPSRDADSNRFYAGLEIESTTRLSGRAVGGVRNFRPRQADESRWFPYIQVALRYRLGPKTALGFRVDRDQQFSAFTAESGTQTSSRLASELALGRRLWGPLEIRIFGGLRRLETDGAVALMLEDGVTEPAVRKDDEWYGGANLGFRFRSWFRIGLEARYSNRKSSFRDLGVEGLLLGVTVRATPGDIVDFVLPQ